MNFAAIYQEATTIPSDEQIVLQQKAELEVNTQRSKLESDKARWLALPDTKSFLADLQKQAENFDNLARDASMKFHSHHNHDLVVGANIQSSTIRNIIAYARGN